MRALMHRRCKDFGMTGPLPRKRWGSCAALWIVSLATWSNTFQIRILLNDGRNWTVRAYICKERFSKRCFWLSILPEAACWGASQSPARRRSSFCGCAFCKRFFRPSPSILCLWSGAGLVRNTKRKEPGLEVSLNRPILCGQYKKEACKG